MAPRTTVETTTRRRAATRGRLIDAAREVLAESGIQGATVEQICERAGFTRGAFYSNFESKDALILDLFRRERDLMMARLQQALEGVLNEPADTDVETLTRVLDHFMSAQPADRTWFLVHQEFVIHAVRHRVIADVYQELWAQTNREFSALVEWAVDALGRRLVIPVEQITLIVLGVFDEAMRNAFLSSTADAFDPTLLRYLLPNLLVAMSEPADTMAG